MNNSILNLKSELLSHGILQLLEGDCVQPMNGPGYPSYPVVYRQHVYFLSSQQNREQFMQDPLTYLSQPSPKPVVPIRIAIIGPPKSGKTTCKSHPTTCIRKKYLVITDFVIII